MKIDIGHSIIALMVVTIVLANGCADKEPASIESNGVVELLSIQELLENRYKYNAKEVAIKGIIVAQCARGCKFNVDDGTGVLFVQMLDEAWERPLPPSMGKIVEVRGVFYQELRPHIIVLKVGDAMVR